MLLDWDRFKTILQKEDKDIQLALVRNNVQFLIEFLTQLLLELKQCESSIKTVEKFPHAGPALTLASIHPYIAYTPHIATLVVTCLIEYSKLEINTISQTNTYKEKSVIWCITRLRRFLSVEREDTRDTETIINHISDLIDSKGTQLNAQKISKLTDTCLSLIHEKRSFGMIEKLVQRALDYSRMTLSDGLLSDEFIYQLAQSDQMKSCYISWSQTLKIELLLNHQDLLEIKVLNLIETCIKLDDASMQAQLMQDDCIELLQISDELSKRFIRLFSEHVVQFHSWKLNKLIQCVYRCVKVPLFQLCQQEIEKATFVHVETHALYDIICKYVYAEGSVLDVPYRRNEAWCLSISFTRFLWYCVYRLIQWTQKENDPWTDQMEDILVYINWVIYPSMDNRESQSLSYFRNWIQSNKGNNRLYDDIPKLWHNLLNSNHILIACFVTTIFFSIDHLHVDQQISLIQSILAEPERKNSIQGNTKKTILLDYLNDIETHTNLYPRLNFQLQYIKDYFS
ncbi:hypothetical protein BDF21DRAFT_497792 [Thamnidium elegans]|nr:hypothetical protein BDF21DRAFT_497792 [Thamnidium elegans]